VDAGITIQYRNLSPHTSRIYTPPAVTFQGYLGSFLTSKKFHIIYVLWKYTQIKGNSGQRRTNQHCAQSTTTARSGVEKPIFPQLVKKFPARHGTPWLIPPLNPTHRQIYPFQATTVSLTCSLISSSQRFPRRFFPSVPKQNSSRITPPPYVPHTLPISSYLIW